jgi:hypothetical protein
MGKSMTLTMRCAPVSLALSAMGASSVMLCLPARASVPNNFPAQCTDSAAQAREWWLDLRAASVAQVSAVQRKTQQARIAKEQEEVRIAAQTLGAEVTANTAMLRNALAVRANPAQLEALRALPQVRAVRPVTHLNRAGRSHPATGPCE